MVERVSVEGYEAFNEEVQKHDGKNVFVLFSGSKSEGGTSWCPDCVTAEPVIDAALSKVTANIVFIYCGVGERDFWKDPNCVFRTDPKMELKGVPTLMKWGTPQKLQESQCSSEDLVSTLFEEE